MKRGKYPCLAVFWALLACSLYGQPDSVLVSKNFQFREGIFLNHQSFRANAPDLNWEEVEATLFTNPQTYLTHIREVKTAEGDRAINPDSIWGICLQGIPYIRLDRNWIQKELATFAPLELRGKICYFDFERIDTVQVKMTAYNPANGLPFRQAMVGKKVEVNLAKILNFDTGEVADFTRDNLLRWIADDPALTQAALELREDELDSKLFKILLIYVDRNGVYIPRQGRADGKHR
ncbi:MAG: hypothetical protein WA004_13685 [Saprospiraceae bacterium]